MADSREIGVPVPLWIDNTEVFSSIQFPVTNAISNEVVHYAHGATPEIAIAAVDSAQRAYRSWSRTTPWERRSLLLAAARNLRLQHDEVALLMKVSTRAITR
jgi:acyl-CoA reductase-like NAD-dependent aldehyde dehydrogenase